MNNTKIEWVDATVNPVVGCPRGCPYCYAKKMNMRFKWVADFNTPQFFEGRLKEFEKITPKSIFINSMSDIAFWGNDQLRAVLSKVLENKQHRYIALTKDLSEYVRKLFEIAAADKEFVKIIAAIKGILFVGETITTQATAEKAHCIRAAGFVQSVSTDFINIEPILEPINIRRKLSGGEYAQIIIGAETGNRRGKVIPPKSWIDNVVRQADEFRLPVFMKNSLREIMGADFRQDPLIWDVNNKKINGGN